jgi:hypothetical protein
MHTPLGAVSGEQGKYFVPNFCLPFFLMISSLEISALASSAWTGSSFE